MTSATAVVELRPITYRLSGRRQLLLSSPVARRRLILLIHPFVLGSGQRLFDGPSAVFELAHTRPTTTGVIAATYHGRIGLAQIGQQTLSVFGMGI
jgi:hypothetical protein